MTPQTHPAYWQSPEQQAELAARAVILAKAKEGCEESLARARDELSLRTWIHRGKVLIEDGVLTGARRTPCSP